MNTRKFALALTACAALGYAVPATAAVVACNSGPGIDLTVDQCIWPDTGPPGANDSLAEVQAAIAAATGVNVDLVLYGKSDDNPELFSFNPDPNSVDTLFTDWTVLDGTLIKYVTIKGGNDFKVYELAEAGASSGAGFTTFGIEVGRNNNQPDISHLSFWTVPGAVPEPGTWAMMILGFGFVGVALRRRRRHSATLSFA